MFTLSNELYNYHLPPVPTNDIVVAASTTTTTTTSTSSAAVCCFPGSTVHAHLNMDSVFFLGEGDRSSFLHSMMQFFGSTYICLWSYDQSNLSQTLFNFLRYMDGLYRERSSDQPSTSSLSGSLAQVRFNEFRQSLFLVDHNRFVPGYALVNNIPYLELKSDDLLKVARVEAQRQFYQAAGIKTAVFMGCNAGEIELGFSDPSQVNIEKEMRNWFPDDFSRQLMVMATTTTMKSHDQQNKPASSSSSLRSLSYDSPEYPPPPPNFLDQQEPIADQHLAAAAAAGALKPSPSIFTTGCPQQSLISHIRSPQIPSIESEDDAIAKAILAVICSNNNNNNPNTNINSNNFHFQPQQNFPIDTTTRGGRESAFKWYGSASSSSASGNLGPKSSTAFRRQSLLKRSIAFLRSIHAMRSRSPQEHNNMQTGSSFGRTSSTQLHHMISERRRREKLNESFQALRSLLPPGTKKDKASVLMGTTEYLSSLKAEVAELSKRNAILEAQILPKKTAAAAAAAGEGEVGITEVSELATTSSSSTGARLIDLHVRRIGEINITDLLARLLEFLKTSSDHHHQISLMSVEANTTLDESSNSVNRLVFRLKIEGEWDESAFQEAVRRILNNQTPQ